MPPPSNNPSLHLQVLSEPFFVVQLQVGQEVPPCVLKDLTDGRGGFFSVTRTKDEVSLVGEAYKWMPKNYKEQSTWMCIKIQGPMEHGKSYPVIVRFVGVLNVSYRFNWHHGWNHFTIEKRKNSRFHAIDMVRSSLHLAFYPWLGITVPRNTDYVLVPTEMLSDAIRALERDGWVFLQGTRSRVARLWYDWPMMSKDQEYLQGTSV